LTNQFGDVPCPLKELTEVKTNYATVKREVILQRMKSDLDSAVLWVPGKLIEGCKQGSHLSFTGKNRSCIRSV
jgi:hypothetical protein